MWNADEIVAILGSVLPILSARGPIVEREIGDVVIALQFLQHVIGADLPALINRVKQFSFEPQYSQSLFIRRLGRLI